MTWRSKLYTMLYDAETLKPQLLIKEDIKNGDIGKHFNVINGAWGGTFNEDSVTIYRWGKKETFPTVYKCYKFTSPPPKEYFDLYPRVNPFSNNTWGVEYEPYFIYFEDLVAKWEIK